MSKTYSVTGLTLKTQPLGEADRLLTVLTPEVGLLRAIVPGARKPKSSLGGRCDLFMVNHLFLVRGKSLDRITQAETLQRYRHLCSDLTRLAIGQYWAELALAQALSDHPQEELYALLNDHLHRLEVNSEVDPMALLCQGIFHLLAGGGIAPQLYHCVASGLAIAPQIQDPRWRIGFSIAAGGVVEPSTQDLTRGQIYYLNSLETWLFQRLSAPDLGALGDHPYPAVWRKIEGILRRYIRHHWDLEVRSAALLNL